MHVAARTRHVKGAKGDADAALADGVSASSRRTRSCRSCSPTMRREPHAMAGTARAHLANMVKGVSKGYRAQARAGRRRLSRRGAGQGPEPTLGFSHPVNFTIPEGITIETPSRPKSSIKGTDRQQVGQVAAEDPRLSVRRSPTRARACVTPASRSSMKEAQEEVSLRHSMHDRPRKSSACAAPSRPA